MAHAFQDDAFQANAFQMNILSVTATTVLQKPVDYALAGDQDQKMPFKSGRLAGRAMRHAFNE